jgi:sulfotransferase
MICCVRSVSWIMDSIERLVQDNAFQLSRLFDFAPGGTVYTRINRLAVSDGLVGYSLDALKQAFYGPHAGKLLLVTYDGMTRRPKETLAAIYDFIAEKPFAHNFENVTYAEEEYDARLGTPGLHTVRRKVENIERKTVLPPELFARFENDAFWTDPARNPNKVRIV